MSRIWTHHVFPSFRGEDVRRDFLSHIQLEFQRMGITLFVDNEIVRGESIGPDLIRAIRESRIAVILLSRNYASSTWCLNELVEIMKCREELGQIVMVIFYKVDPTDVKKLSGYFGKVFKRTCAKKRKEDIRRWKQALAKVATIAGYHSTHWDNEAVMIKHIATDISNMLNNSISSSDFDGLVGMKPHMEKMKSLLCLDLNEVRMIGIWGPAGIGKTSIARVAYNQLSKSYQLSVFMENIKANYTKPCSDEYSTKLQLQQQFMSQITNHKDMEIPHLGVAQDRLKDKKLLVVLDGVDQLVQLEAMAKETRWFGPGSRIIITTQDHKLLRAHGINHIYKVDFPSTYEALQIFCMYAFGQKFPKDGFEELAETVTKLTGELPLGLRVMGSHFRGMSKREWRKSLPGLETSLDADIQSILMFGYNALDDRNKELFLHIACFFNGEEIEKVEEHLAKKLVDVRQRLNVLAEKSLISIESGYVIIKMHSLLVKLGVEIVRKQSTNEPGQRQFLVDRGDICEVLADATGSKSVIGIDFDSSGFSKKLDISDTAFERMPNLQFLRVNDIGSTLQLPRGLNDLSRKLRLLHWSCFPMTCLPSIVSFEFLVELKIHRSKLEKFWEGIKPLQNLKRMDLSDSVRLKELPDLSTATNLVELNLSNCYRLLEIPSSIRNATKLEKLYLIGCSSLVKFPFLGNTANLRELNLRECSSLLKFPSIGNTTNLKILFLGGCSSLVEFPFIENSINLNYVDFKSVSNMLELPFSIRNAIDLCDLYLRNCSGLIKLPSSIGNCINLYRLDLANCSSLIKIPSSIGNATKLENIDLSNCSNLVELPVSIGNLRKLKMLRLVGCSKLKVLPTNTNFKYLDELDLTNCSMLESFLEIPTNVRVLAVRETTIEDEPPLIRSWPPLDEERMSYYENLEDITHDLDIIKKLYLGDTKKEQGVSPWVKFFLARIVLKGCRKLVSLPHIADSVSLIDAQDCETLERIDCFFRNPMYFLNFGKCSKLNQEARDLIIQTPVSRHAVLPGVEVPKYFTHRVANGGPLRVKLNEKPLTTSIRFKACILLVYKGDDDEFFSPTGLFVTCGQSGQFLCPVFTDHLYTFEVEADVTSSEHVFEFRVKHYDKWKIGECGVRQLLEVASCC